MTQLNFDLRETHMIGSKTREYIVGPIAQQATSAQHILLTGISYAYPPFRFVRIQPTMGQILVSLEGEGMVWIENHWQKIDVQKAYITPPGCQHAYYAMMDGERPWKIAWVMFAATEQSPIIQRKPTIQAVDPQPLLLAVEGLYHESITQAEELVMHQWAQLIRLYAQRLVGAPQNSDIRLARLWRQVDASLAHPWTCEELANSIGVSSEHLRRLCQQQFGHSPLRHLTILRMQRAMALLSSGSFTVAHVAYQVGYENPYAFSNAFQRYVGVPPSHYRLLPRDYITSPVRLLTV